MSIKIADHIAAIPPSPTLSLSAKVKAMIADGQDVIDLSAGEPDFALPEEFRDGIIAALVAGHTTYPPVPGIAKLRQAIADDLQTRHGLTYAAEQILVSTGAKQPLAMAFQAVLQQGDTAIVPAPYWVSYADQVRLCRATPVMVNCTAQTNYKLTPEMLRSVLTPSCKAIILGSPSNPTGAIYSAAEWQALATILREFPNLLIIADQIYDQLVYDGQQAPALLSVAPDLALQTIIIDGVSKAYAATGLRLGWAAGPLPLIKAMSSIQGHTTSGACSIIQHGALAMLNSPTRAKEVAHMVTTYQARRDTLIQRLQAAPQIHPFKPQGAFYLWCDIAATGLNDTDFATRLLEEQGVAVVPGSAFGAPNHIRMHFAASDAILAKAAQRIVDFCNGLSQQPNLAASA